MDADPRRFENSKTGMPVQEGIRGAKPPLRSQQSQPNLRSSAFICVHLRFASSFVAIGQRFASLMERPLTAASIRGYPNEHNEPVRAWPKEICSPGWPRPDRHWQPKGKPPTGVSIWRIRLRPAGMRPTRKPLRSRLATDRAIRGRACPGPTRCLREDRQSIARQRYSQPTATG